MSGLRFKKASRRQAKLRMALVGPAGSGKTYTSLRIACAMGKALGMRVGVIDTENGTAAKYADQFDFDCIDDLPSHSPATYVDALGAAAAQGVGILIVDSLSHAWAGRGGALEMVDRAARRSQSGNAFAAWRDVTPEHNRLVDALIRYPGHLIATMRAKTEWVMDQGKNGKLVPRKVGLAPVQRDGLEYEFDVVADLTIDNEMVVTKTRCSALNGEMFTKPGEDVAKTLLTWLNQGDAPPSRPAPSRHPVETVVDETFPGSRRVEPTGPTVAESLGAGQGPREVEFPPPQPDGAAEADWTTLNAILKELHPSDKEARRQWYVRELKLHHKSGGATIKDGFVALAADRRAEVIRKASEDVERMRMPGWADGDREPGAEG